MEPEEYFERVVRFLETNGWNTSTTELNETTYVVTGTRQSETYYDRMLAMVAIDEETTLTPDHVEYLHRAAEENDVDQLMATGRGGMNEQAREMAEELAVQWIEPETIDEAFLDGFSVEETGMLERNGLDGGILTGVSGRQYGWLLGLYLVVALAVGSIAIILEILVSDPTPLTSVLLPGSIVLVGPLLAVLGAPSILSEPGDQAVLGVFLGTAAGYLLFAFVLSVITAGTGIGTNADIFSRIDTLVAVLALTVPVGFLGIVGVRLRSQQVER